MSISRRPFDTGWFRDVMASALQIPVFLFIALLAALPSLSRAEADAKITVHLVELIQKVPFRRGGLRIQLEILIHEILKRLLCQP